MCTTASFSCGFLTCRTAPNEKCLLLHVGDLTKDACWQEQGVKSTSLSVYHLHCYVVTLQTSGVHFMFWSIQFSTGRNYQSTRRAAVAWRLARRVCDCKVASLTPRTIWEYVRWGRRMRHTLSSPQQLLLKCPYVRQRASKWSRGNSLVMLGSSHQMRLLLCVETPRRVRYMIFMSLPGLKMWVNKRKPDWIDGVFHRNSILGHYVDGRTHKIISILSCSASYKCNSVTLRPSSANMLTRLAGFPVCLQQKTLKEIFLPVKISLVHVNRSLSNVPSMWKGMKCTNLVLCKKFVWIWSCSSLSFSCFPGQRVLSCSAAVPGR